MVKFEIRLFEEQAEALAQFVKRVGFNDLRPLAASDDEAYFMLDAMLQIQKELAEVGFAPR